MLLLQPLHPSPPSACSREDFEFKICVRTRTFLRVLTRAQLCAASTEVLFLRLQKTTLGIDKRQTREVNVVSTSPFVLW